MYTVKTYVDKSDIDGLGVFTAEKITKGQIVWRFEPNLDRIISKKQFKKFPKIAQDHVRKCGFLLKDRKNYMLGVDNDIYANHSKDNNLAENFSKRYKKYHTMVASRDIEIDEELTQNYFEYDDNRDANYKLTHFNS